MLVVVQVVVELVVLLLLLVVVVVVVVVVVEEAVAACSSSSSSRTSTNNSSLFIYYYIHYYKQISDRLDTKLLAWTQLRLFGTVEFRPFDFMTSTIKTIVNKPTIFIHSNTRQPITCSNEIHINTNTLSTGCRGYCHDA